MSYDFSETFTVQIPNVEQQLTAFEESAFSQKHGLVIEVAAIHAGATANFNYYSEEELAKSVNTWLEPYPKPIIMNHDPHSEAVGRVIGAKMDVEEDGTPFTRLQVAILDPEAIKKVSDGRYLTGSVGGRADEAVCSICNTDWAKPKESRGLPCVHQRGKVYSGKVAMMQMKNIGFKEYSFVNMPADSKSSVLKLGSESEEGWIKPARFFVVDMVQEGLVEYTESAQKDILEGLRKKDALPLYMGIKGAFISAQAVHEEEDLSIKDSVIVDKSDTSNVNDPNSEENEMAKEAAQELLDDEDILAVAEGLSADLSAQADNDEDASEEEDQDSEESKDAEEEADAEATDESEEDSEEEAAEEGEDKRAEGQEKPHDRDVNPANSDGADKSRESDDEDEATDEDAAEESDDTDAATDEQAEEAELSESEDDTTEPHACEHENRVAELTEENARLRKALHHNLVERVVDTKIALGILSTESRQDEINEHAERTGASLADNLRDLAKMEPRAFSSAALEMDQNSEIVGNEVNTSTIGDDGDEIAEHTSDPTSQFEDLMVDVLMNRKKA